ncbi:ImmA/IrrE family metallo-endopeptidase [Aquabacterium sp. CECT 9606]|uniref:ImmA/IrrE family metallo-endopeptidase n=1 Tax=Aquabacterium sp. CECT 9606 TaxID=2845822 RepID=UPI001E3C04E8|nr:hypothetical protein [Aquabacterium sp. CECT 9606]CAH0355538.1 hypothetical protein AQB9606_04263 [Aquabacterium sp. CECT 9606]
MSPVWGRAIFYFEANAFNGSAIILEAQELAPIPWPLSLSPERVRELERLAEDGHQIHRGQRQYDIHPSFASLRNTVLYRTLLHEVGHHVDHRDCTEETWNTRTSSQKEDFAHRYAAEKARLLRAAGVSPFPPMVNQVEMIAAGLRTEWFAFHERA